MNEKNEKSKAVASPDRGNEAIGRADQGAQEIRRGEVERQTKQKKRQALHEVQTAQIERDLRKKRIGDGVASDEEIHAEAQALEDDARARSGRVRALASQGTPA